MFAESDTETDTAGTRKSLTGRGITEALDTGQGGGRGHHTIEVIAYTRESAVKDRTRILSGGGHKSCTQGNRPQRSCESGVECVGNINPSGKGMNGNCYSTDGVNPTLTTNKGEGNKIAIPVLTPDRAVKRQNGRRFKEDGEESFTLTAQDRHGVAIEVTGYNATLKRGGGMTDTTLALCARDYKGLSGSNQMMTAAAMCLRLTKESSPKKEKSQTVLNQERTEDCHEESKREH